MSTPNHSTYADQADPAATPPLRATVYVCRWPDIPAVEAPGFPKGKFSPTTSTIIAGATEAVLVDAPPLERFPNARCVALPNVIEAMKQTMELQDLQWEMLFGDATVKGGPLPAPLEGDTLYVDGSPISIIEVK